MTSLVSSGVAALLIAVDVGHYAAEPGAIAASRKTELEFNLALATEVKRALEAAGFRVRMIGNEPLLHHRTRQAAGADLFLSIHHDSVKQAYIAEAGKFSGYSLFVSRRNPAVEKSLACASAIGAHLRGAGLVPSRYHADPVLGENRPFADEVNGVHFYDNLAIAHTAEMPSVLVEAGVIVNPEEERMLDQPTVRSTIAAAIARGVRSCLP